MRAKRYVRSFSEAERVVIEAGLKSQDIFVLRRSQMLLLSSEGFSTEEIASKVGYHQESVRQIIKKFDEKGLAVLKQGSRKPLTQTRSISSSNAKKIKELLRRSPREFKKSSSIWTLELLAEVSYEHGLSRRKVSDETIRTTLKELGVNWKRAKHWLSSSDPHYAHKKSAKKA